MADDKKKLNTIGSKLSDKIGLFIDKVLTFGGGLQFDQSDINNAVKAIDAETDYEIDSIKILKLKKILINLKKY